MITVESSKRKTRSKYGIEYKKKMEKMKTEK